MTLSGMVFSIELQLGKMTFVVALSTLFRCVDPATETQIECKIATLTSTEIPVVSITEVVLKLILSVSNHPKCSLTLNLG